MFVYADNRWHHVKKSLEAEEAPHFHTSCGVILKGQFETTDDELLLGSKFCCARCILELSKSSGETA